MQEFEPVVDTLPIRRFTDALPTKSMGLPVAVSSLAILMWVARTCTPATIAPIGATVLGSSLAGIKNLIVGVWSIGSY